MVNSKGRNWCFTDFDVSEGEKKKYVDLYEDGELRYLIIGDEVTKDGRPHLQGYMCFKNPVRFSKIKKIFPQLHFNLADGNSLENFNYCSKGGVFQEWGSRPMTPKERGLTDHEKWKGVILSAELGTCKDEYPGEWVRYNTTLKKMYKPYYPEFSPYSGIWIYGPTGTGKSRYARAKYPNPYLKGKSKWWDGYEHQENVLIDDVTMDHSFLAQFLLNWVDHYPFPAEYKGGQTEYRPKNIIVTSNFTMDEVFKDLLPQTLDALKRRFEVKCIPHGVTFESLMTDEERESQPSPYTQRLWVACNYPNCDCSGCCDHRTDAGSDDGDVCRIEGASMRLIRSDQEGFDDLISHAQENMSE